MLGLYLNELKKGINRIEFRFIWIMFLVLCISAFFVNCLEFYGASCSFIRKASQMNIITSSYSTYFLSLVTVLLPLLSGFLYSDNLALEKNGGTLSLLLTRTSLKKIMLSKIFAVLTIPFVISFFSLNVNILLTYFAFPNFGGDNVLNLPAYDIGIQQYSPLYAFDLLRLNSEWGYTYIYVFLISLFASILSLFSFAVVNFINKNCYLTIIGIFIVFVIIGMVLGLLGLGNLSWHVAFNSNALGSALTPFIWLLGLSMIAIGLIIAYSKKMELIE